MMDDATRKHAFNHYACVMVDIDLSKIIFDEVMVEQ
jgi:hypothetical protein